MSDIVTYVLYIVAVFHGVAFVLESVGWALTPLGRRLILKVNPGLEEADIPEETTSSPWAKAQMRTLRIFYANMGVYNLMLALLAAYALVLHAYGADPGAEESLFEARLDGPLVVVLGAEGRGMRRLTRRACTRLLRVPVSGSVASLNVSVAAGVVLFEAVRQRLVSP